MTLQERLDGLITALGTDHKAQQTALQNINTQIGTLTNLSTTDKTNLVNAINEVFALAQSGSSVINDALVTSLSKTYSIDKIKAELASLKTELLGGATNLFDTLSEIESYINSDQSAGSALALQVGNRVSYTTADNRTLAEKQQARTNIDAFGSIESS